MKSYDYIVVKGTYVGYLFLIQHSHGKKHNTIMIMIQSSNTTATILKTTETSTILITILIRKILGHYL